MLPSAVNTKRSLIQTWRFAVTIIAICWACSACKFNQKSSLNTTSAHAVQNMFIGTESVAGLKDLYNKIPLGRASAGLTPVTELDESVPRFVLVDQTNAQPMDEIIRQLIRLQSPQKDAQEPLFWLSLESTDDGPSDALGQDLSLDSLVRLTSWDSTSGLIRYKHVGQSVDESQQISFFQGKALLPVPGAVIEEELALIESMYPLKPRVHFLNVATGGALHFMSWLNAFGPIKLKEIDSQTGESPTTKQLFYRLNPLLKRVRTAEGVSFPASVTGYQSTDGSSFESTPSDVKIPSFDHQLTLLRSDSASRYLSWVNPANAHPDPYQGYLLAQSLAGSPDSLDANDAFPQTIEGLLPFRLTKVSPEVSLTKSKRVMTRVAVVSDRPWGNGNDLNDLVSRALWAKGSEPLGTSEGQFILAGVRAYAYTASRLLRIIRSLSSQGFCHNNIRLSSIKLIPDGENTQIQLADFGEMTKVGESPRTSGRILSDALPVLRRSKCKPGSDLVSWALLNTQLLFEDAQGSRFLGRSDQDKAPLMSVKGRRTNDLENLYRWYQSAVDARYTALEKRVAALHALTPDDKAEATLILSQFKSTVLDLLEDVQQRNPNLYDQTDTLLAEADDMEAKYERSITDLRRAMIRDFH